MKQIFLWIVVGYLWVWAKLALMFCRPQQIIGVAGSVGKSSTRVLLHEVLKDSFPTIALSGNSETGIALSILGIWPRNYSPVDWLRMIAIAPFGLFHLRGKTHVIVEMGTDGLRPPRNMGFLLTLIKPTIAIHLSATATHTLQFGEGLAVGETEDRYASVLARIACEDGRIVTESGSSLNIYNHDDLNIRSYITTFQKNSPQVEYKSFGVGKTCDVQLLTYTVTEKGSVFILKTKEGEQIVVNIDSYILPGIFWQNIAATYLAASELGVSKSDIERSLSSKLSLPKGRSSLFSGVNDSLIIDSSYNASRVPMMELLTTARTVAKRSDRPLVVLFGDMRELGDDAEKEHKEVVKALIQATPKEVYLVGELTKKYMVEDLKKSGISTSWHQSSIKLGAALKDLLPKRSLVLVKGSQNTIFLEETVARILQNPSDVDKLCRYDAGWRAIKQKYFQSTSR